MSKQPVPHHDHLLSLRSAVVLFLAVLLGVAAGGLTYLATRSAALAILAGGSTFAGGVVWLHKLIEP